MINDFISVKRAEHLRKNHESGIIREPLFGILLLNRNQEILFLDETATEILKFAFENKQPAKHIKFLWKTSQAITTEKGDPLSYENSPISKALDTSETQSSSLVVRLKNGEQQCIYFKCEPITKPYENHPFSVVCRVSDLTEGEQNYHQAQKRLFSSFSNQTSNLLWMIDEETNLVFCNQAFSQYFNLTANDLNKKIIEVVPEAVAKALYNDHLKVLQKGEAIIKEQPVRLADGTTSNFLIHIFPLDGTGNKMVGGHAVHLADRYEIEKLLRDANERLLHLNHLAHHAIWEWDMGTGRVFRNEHLLDMIGYPIEQVSDLNWWLERIHSEDRSKLEQAIEEATEKKQMSWEQSYRFRCADGTYRHVVDRGFVVYEKDSPVKMIGSLKDVTELKELENQLLEEKIKKQKEISETMIQVQEQERTRLGRELHDNVNQILTSVRLYIAMLNPESFNEKEIKQKCISYVDMAMEEIRRLSKDLVVPQLKETTLVENIKTLISDINHCDTVKLTFTHSHENFLLSSGKKLTLYRIIQEQVKNILKYSKASEANILLQYKNANIELIIKDNGIGFDAKKTLRGVGLSSIHERTRFYNGKAEIKTAPGKGCTLKVTMPIHCA